MIFNLLLTSPFPWTFAAGVCAGGFFSSLTRSAARARDPERSRERKGFAAAVALCLCLVFALCAVFVPGPEKIWNTTIVIFFLAVTAVFFLVFRFRKAIGLPFLLLGGALVLAVVLFFQAVTAFTGETEIARLQVKRVSEGVMKFDLVDRAGQATALEMPGTHLGAEVKEIIFDDFFVFFGAKTAYRFLGLKSAQVRPGSEMTQELRAYELARPTGVSESLYRFVESNPALIPGVKTVQVQVTYTAVKPGAVYSIRVQHDSGVEIMSVRLREK